MFLQKLSSSLHFTIVYLPLPMCVYLCTFHCCFLLSSAGNESCPQPQTSEHLAAIEIMKLKHIIILQNKIDLIRDTQAKDQYQEILKFVQGKGCGYECQLEKCVYFQPHTNCYLETSVSLQISESLLFAHVSQLETLLVFVCETVQLVPESLMYLTGTVAEGAPVVPISAQLKYNIEVVCEYVIKKIPVPLRDFTSEPRLIGKHHTYILINSCSVYLMFLQ